MLCVFHVFQAVGYYGFGTLVPTVLAAKGYAIVESLGFTSLTFIGYPVGSALSLPVIERVDRSWLIVGSAIAMSVFGLASASALTGGHRRRGVPVHVCSNFFSNALHMFQVEIFPTRIRSTAVSTSYSLSRLSGAMLPFISVAALDNLGPTAVFLGSAAILVVVCLDVGLLGPRSTGMNLEDSSDELAGAAERRVDDGPRFSREGRTAVARAGDTRDRWSVSGAAAAACPYGVRAARSSWACPASASG